MEKDNSDRKSTPVVKEKKTKVATIAEGFESTPRTGNKTAKVSASSNAHEKTKLPGGSTAKMTTMTNPILEVKPATGHEEPKSHGWEAGTPILSAHHTVKSTTGDPKARAEGKVKFLVVDEKVKPDAMGHKVESSESESVIRRETAKAVDSDKTEKAEAGGSQGKKDVKDERAFWEKMREYVRRRPILCTTDRIMKEVPFPLRHKLTMKDFIQKSGKPELGFLRRHLEGEGRLQVEALKYVIEKATSIMAQEPNLLRIDDSVKVIGALCGCFYDLLAILDEYRNDDDKTLFLGSYVNNGMFGVEVVVYLWALKMAYPKRIFLLRGHDECRHLTKTDFKNECLAKYNLEVYECIMNAFDRLPLAAIINDKVLCLHGGISPELFSLRDIDSVNRVREPPTQGLFTDLLWADPDFKNLNLGNPTFRFNTERRVSYYFSYEALIHFLSKNRLHFLVRSSEVLMEGYKYFGYSPEDRKNKALTCLSLFSAPNYRDRRNKGAVLLLSPATVTVKQHLWVPQPYWLPGFIDAFTWSIPFIVDSVTLMIADLFHLMDRDDYIVVMKKEREKALKREYILDSARGMSHDSSPALASDKDPSKIVSFLGRNKILSLNYSQKQRSKSHVSRSEKIINKKVSRTKPSERFMDFSSPVVRKESLSTSPSRIIRTANWKFSSARVTKSATSNHPLFSKPSCIEPMALGEDF